VKTFSKAVLISPIVALFLAASTAKANKFSFVLAAFVKLVKETSTFF
jgi:hypothetical protein